MPILKNAIKKMHQDAKKTAVNQGVKTHLKTVLAKAKKSGDMTAAFSALDKAAKTNLIHKNKADRLKSRLSKFAKPVEKPTASKPATKTKAKAKIKTK